MIYSAAHCRTVGAPVAYGLETFRNRTAELDQLCAALAAPAVRVVTILGRRGIGKSALAAKLAELAAEGTAGYRPLGVVNVSARTAGVSVERIYVDVAELIGGETERELMAAWSSGKPLQYKIMRLLSALRPLHSLVVVDNLEDYLRPEGDFLHDDLRIFFDTVFRVPEPPKFVITSQIPVAFPTELRRYEHRLRLDAGLPTAEAIALVRDLDPDGEARLRDLDAAELARLVVTVHGIPRALELAVSALTQDLLTLPSLTELIETFPLRDDIVSGLSQRNYGRLDPTERLAMDVLAVLGRPATAEAVEWILEPLAPGVDVAPALAGLGRTHVVSVDRATRTFALHPLDTDLIYARLPATGPVARRALERRAAHWYLRDAPHRETWRSSDDLRAYRSAFAHRVRAGDHDQAAQLLEDIGDYLTWQGSAAIAVEMYEKVHGRISDPDIVFHHLIGFGFARTIGGPVRDAVPLLEEALAIADGLGDPGRREKALRLLAGAYRPMGRLDEAIAAASEAASLALAAGDRDSASHSLLNLSLSQSYAARPEDAKATAARIHRLADETDDHYLRGRAHDAHSLACLTAWEFGPAYDAAVAAIAAYERCGVPEAIGYTRNVQGLAALGLDRHDDAIAALRTGADDPLNAENPRAEGLCRFNLAWTHLVVGQVPDALREIGLAVEAFAQAASAEAHAAALLEIAINAVCAGDTAKAEKALRDTAKRARDNADLCPATWLIRAADELRTAAEGSPAVPGPRAADESRSETP